MSHSSVDRGLAQRLKEELEREGCEPWQFNLSAIPGTDAWRTVLELIEKSDYVIAVLSRAAVSSRAVQEEIAHAHYSSMNSTNGRPRIVPVVIQDDVQIPRQIVRTVQLRFHEDQFPIDFGRLLQALGVDMRVSSSTPDRNKPLSPKGESNRKQEVLKDSRAKLGLHTAKKPNQFPEGRTRVQQFFDHLRSGEFGPFSPYRDDWFDKIEMLVAERKHSANRIVIKVARQAVAEGVKLPFVAIERFLFTLLRRCPVLFDHAGAAHDPQAPSSFGVPIVALPHEWRTLVEAEILLYLATIPMGLRASEFNDIGFVMWPRLQPDERHQRVEQCFAGLCSQGKLLINDGIVLVPA